jgi:hypothetical protein
MVIGFKEQFVEPILKGNKIHTIREDKHDRWKVGMAMHMATGVRTKKYNQFEVKKCTGVESIDLDPKSRKIFIDAINNHTYCGIELKEKEIMFLVKNDGFNSVDDFWDWFREPFYGKIIHWTDFKYIN